VGHRSGHGAGRPSRLACAFAAALVLLLSASGCGKEKQTLTVFAAASLTGPFTSLGRTFEASHPGESVRFSFGDSEALARRVAQGATVDVFAAAGASAMRRSGAPTSRVFARDGLGDYLIGAAPETAHLVLAREFIDLVLSDEGRRVLAGAGFTPV
jgi:ABC-type molybdate transport system substrate-binding protein